MENTQSLSIRFLIFCVKYEFVWSCYITIQNLENTIPPCYFDGTKIVKLKQVLKNTRKIVSLLASPYFSGSLYITHLR